MESLTDRHSAMALPAFADCQGLEEWSLNVLSLPKIAPDAHLFILDEKGIVLAEGAQEIFFLNRAATVVWCHLDLGHEADKIVAALQKMLGLARDAARHELSNTIAAWDELGLLAGSNSSDRAVPNEKRDAAASPGTTGKLHSSRAPLGAIERKYALAKSRFRVRFSGLEEERLIHPVIAHLEIAEPESGTEVVIEIMRRPEGGFVIFRDSQPVEQCQDPSSLAPIVKALLFRAEINAGDYLLGIHAGAVGDGEGCLLMPGSSGSGKSTLTAVLCRAGYSYFTDELALLEESTFAVRAIPLGLCIKDTAWDLMTKYYPQLPDMAVHHRGDGKIVRYLTPPCDSEGPVGASSPVRHIIFPKYDASAPTGLSPLGKGATLQRLLRECVSLPVRLNKRRIAELLTWIELVPGCELRFSSLDQAVSLIQNLRPPGTRGSPPQR